MHTVTTDKQQQARNLIGHLQSLKTDFRLFRTEINRAIKQIRDKGNRSPENDRQAVLNAIEKNYCHTLEDLADELPAIGRDELKEVLADLLTRGKIHQTTRGRIGETGAKQPFYFVP